MRGPTSNVRSEAATAGGTGSSMGMLFLIISIVPIAIGALAAIVAVSAARPRSYLCVVAVFFALYFSPSTSHVLLLTCRPPLALSPQVFSC